MHKLWLFTLIVLTTTRTSFAESVQEIFSCFTAKQPPPIDFVNQNSFLIYLNGAVVTFTENKDGKFEMASLEAIQGIETTFWIGKGKLYYRKFKESKDKFYIRDFLKNTTMVYSTAQIMRSTNFIFNKMHKLHNDQLLATVRNTITQEKFIAIIDTRINEQWELLKLHSIPTTPLFISPSKNYVMFSNSYQKQAIISLNVSGKEESKPINVYGAWKVKLNTDDTLIAKANHDKINIVYFPQLRTRKTQVTLSLSATASYLDFLWINNHMIASVYQVFVGSIKMLCLRLTDINSNGPSQSEFIDIIDSKDIIIEMWSFGESLKHIIISAQQGVVFKLYRFTFLVDTMELAQIKLFS